MSNALSFQNDWSSYDLAIAGSDQIWHKWREDEKELPYYYLQFMPQDKRVAYAASFGFEEFPELLSATSIRRSQRCGIDSKYRRSLSCGRSVQSVARSHQTFLQWCFPENRSEFRVYRNLPVGSGCFDAVR